MLEKYIVTARVYGQFTLLLYTVSHRAKNVEMYKNNFSAMYTVVRQHRQNVTYYNRSYSVRYCL